MSELRDAVQKLLDAKPDPTAVERLTAETIRRRTTPYFRGDIDDQFLIGLKDMPGVTLCNLCGSVIPGGPHQERALEKHLGWHNRTESRLAKLEREA